jgi:glycosyltransferase involved in cell wall biosynthesis
LPVLEAMRCATPVLTSNTPSLPEVGGDAVLYVDPRRPDEIAAGLHRLASRPELRAELVARGRGRAALFSWARMAEQTLRVYNERESAGVDAFAPLLVVHTACQ